MPPVSPPGVPTESSERTADGGPDELAPGTRLGNFVVLARIGAGGMGTVFLAFDAELDRRVAIKLLHRSSDDAGGPEVARERLLAEAQAMARLQHPNVVTVLQTGVWEDRVFLAMEYVEGNSLRGWLAEPGRTDKERLAALVDSGRGLAAAHAAGLVHRDFKPDNVLVGKDGRARVTDFGLAARETEARDHTPVDEVPELRNWDEDSSSAGATEQGSLVGTPSYMAPEQLTGHPADTRSDQFAFAVTAWEAFAGTRPFDLDGLRQLAITQLSAERGEPPGSRRKTGPGAAPLAQPSGMPTWVYRALLKSLSVDPDRRFPSMDALLAQLANDPRVRRRQRALVSVAGLVAAIGIGSLVLQQQEARAARCSGGTERMSEVIGKRQRGEVERAFLATSAPDAQERFARTAAELDAYAKGWADMHHEACAATRVREVQSEEVMGLRIACLDRRRNELRELVALLRGADEKLVDRGPQAVRSLPSVQVCADVESLSAPVPLPVEPERRKGIRKAEDGLARLEALRAAGRPRDGAAAAREVWREVAPLDYAPVAAEALLYRGIFEFATGKAKEGEQTLTEAVVTADRGRTDGPRARSALWLTRILTDQGRLDEAELWLKLGSAATERAGSANRLASFMHERQAELHRVQGRYAESLESWERAAQAYEVEHGSDAIERAPSLSGAANILNLLGRNQEAIPLLEQSLQLIERERGTDHVALIAPLFVLTMQQIDAKEFDRANANADRAVAIARLRFGTEHTRTADILDLKATVMQAKGDFAAAVEVYRESLALRRKLLPADHEDLSYSYDGIGQSLLGLGSLDAAREALERALALRGPDPFDRAETRFALARALWPQRGGRARARELARQAIADYEAAENGDKAKVVHAWLESVAP